MMMTLVEFTRLYSEDSSCIDALAKLKWSDGFKCRKCGHDRAHHLASRPKIFECASCGQQESVTAGTVFHKTKTPLSKWFLAAYLILRDKRGISAMFLSRELDLRYETAWLILHKLRHALTERDEFRLDSFVEIDETFYGGRRQKGARGRSMGPNKSLIVAAVEKKVAPKRTTGKPGGVKGSGWRSGSARVAVLPGASADQLGAFIRSNVRPKTMIITDGFRGYKGLDDYRHIPVVQGDGRNAEQNQPLVHMVFSGIKTWLNGTHHGVSAKHLPRYLREWSYRYNRRFNSDFTPEYVLRRAVTRATITYDQLIAGVKPEGA